MNEYLYGIKSVHISEILKELLLGVLNRIYKKILHELINSLHYEKIIELDLSQYVMITESHRKNQDYCNNS